MTTITLPPLLIGLYSPQAAKYSGTVIYRGIDGKECHVTCVTTDEGGIPEYKWEDTIRVGYMTDYLRQGMRGSING